ncbi:MAG: MerR family DNA-binding transcriptional regulator [Patescibacteria group bacterium]|jgi:excisionase family DNA binding protein
MYNFTEQFLTISQAAEYLGITETTLRRWDKNGSFSSTFISPGGHRYYSLADLGKKTKGIFRLGQDWASAITPPALAKEFYCPTSDIFKARLEHLAYELTNTKSVQNIASLISSAAGEIGNNSYDHNIGNWPDITGTFFAYDIGKRMVVLADRGVGILTTLRRIKHDLKNDAEALNVAFTEVLSSRKSEHRGNGLKYVKAAIEKARANLSFQTGDAILTISPDKTDFKILSAATTVHGCLSLLKF